jgi:hypothetical protein
MRAVAALDAWLEAAGITEGPVFRSVDRHGNVGAGALTDRQVARIVKEVCARVGMDPAIYPDTRCAPASSPARSMPGRIR